jgi:hypothetical protein
MKTTREIKAFDPTDPKLKAFLGENETPAAPAVAAATKESKPRAAKPAKTAKPAKKAPATKKTEAPATPAVKPAKAAKKETAPAAPVRRELIIPEATVNDRAIGKFNVEMPITLRKQIKQASLNTGRSMNELIISVLDQAFG